MKKVDVLRDLLSCLHIAIAIMTENTKDDRLKRLVSIMEADLEILEG
jgi:hypothetical protein